MGADVFPTEFAVLHFKRAAVKREGPRRQAGPLRSCSAGYLAVTVLEMVLPLRP